ncbi:MAG: four-helix bundle copper-binding protein [Bdellovibrio sp.]
MPINKIQDSDTTRCINLCIECTRHCLETFQYCVEQKGTAFSGKHLSLLQSCAESCQINSHLLIADSEFQNQSCELTFEICRACAIECERYPEDEVFVKCAEICRDCAESCRALSGMTVQLPGQQGKVVSSQQAART